jgi:hypothetical protein
LGTVDQERLDEFKAKETPSPSLHSSKYYPNAAASLRVSVPTTVAIAVDLLPPRNSAAAGE